jgi:opacity protein-like surface antigen
MEISRNIMALRACALALALAPATATAADLGGAKMTPHPAFEPSSAVHRYLYVRGDMGVARHKFGGFSQTELADNNGSFLTSSIDDAVIVSAGIGVKFSARLRMDVTGEYRGSAQVRALDNVTATLVQPDGQLQANTAYTGSMTSYVGLLNGYWDLFTIRGITPYVGAGIGFAHNRAGEFQTTSVANFTDPSGVPLTELTTGSSAAASKTSFAWALMAGASLDLTANSKLDIGYRYLNMGSGVSMATGLIDCVCGTTGSPLKAHDLHAHEIRIGMRWALNAPQEVARSMK